ncbi:hypothetical protein [Mycolicibacter longobardus]|nr:hypothetical protein [Mycolicibacter longobardus]
MPAQAWVTLIVSGLAAVGVIVTWRQKNRADRRSEMVAADDLVA